MTLKEKIHHHYVQVINNKVQLLQQVLADLKESGTNETKSTAGDKHETALAMLQIEEANIRSQLQEVVEQKMILEKIKPGLTPVVIVSGSLVKTNLGYLFISVALGKTIIEGNVIIAISPKSPLGNRLMGLSTGGSAAINGMEYRVENIE